MQHSDKWNTTSQILKPKNIKLRDINGLTSSQIKKMSVRCRSQDKPTRAAALMGAPSCTWQETPAWASPQ